MDYKKQNIQNYFLYDTPVDNLFITEYMVSAPEKAVKVYLLASMHAEYGLPLDAAGLARKLRISAEEVSDAWEYWVKQGLVRKVFKDPDNREDYAIELLNIREMMFGRRTVTQSQPAPGPFLVDDEQLSRLLRDVEAETGRLLEAKEPEEIASWMSEYGMDPQVILLGYRYCTQRGRSNRFRYVGQVLKDWRAKGLATAAQVEDSLAAADRHFEFYRAVMKELGFHRSATEPEKRIMDSWFDKLECSLEDVMDACRKTTGISNPNINYVNSVLVGRYNEKHQEEQPVTQENLFARVEALYESIREENKKKTQQIRSDIFTKIPQMQSILKDIRECSFALSSAMLKRAGGTELAELRKKMEGLNAMKASLLAKNGYEENALEAVYDCPKCRDTGVLDDGSRCSCFAEKAEMLLKNNGRQERPTV